VVPGQLSMPRVAIVTALPKEFVAIHALLTNPIKHSEATARGNINVVLGTLPARNGLSHSIVIALIGVGNNMSAAATSQLLHLFPSVLTVLMVGIAGGIPNPAKPFDHVRLGDVVVSAEVVQYDFVKDEFVRETPRHPARPSSITLLRAVDDVEVSGLLGSPDWFGFIETGITKLGWNRPPSATD